MSAFAIRSGTPSDARAIAALINHEIRTGLAIWRYAERPESEIASMLMDRLTARQAVYVASVNDEVVGWASYGPFRAGEGYGPTMEHSVHVAPTHQRRGIATALMERVIDHAATAGVHSLIGAIESTNSTSIALHERLGFNEVGRLQEVGRKFDQWLNLVLMQNIIGQQISQNETHNED